MKKKLPEDVSYDGGGFRGDRGGGDNSLGEYSKFRNTRKDGMVNHFNDLLTTYL